MYGGVNVLAPLAGESAALVEQVSRSVTLVHSHHGHGSGIVWGDGLVITNHHVVGGREAVVETLDGARLRAHAVKLDAYNDLAALRVEGLLLPVPPIGDSTGLRLGELVLAVGNPFGLRGVATLGIVSAIGDITVGDGARRELLQADLELAPGNSGGPLTDIAGRVVGVASMVMRPGMALAIPTHVVQRFVRSLDWSAGRGEGFY